MNSTDGEPPGVGSSGPPRYAGLSTRELIARARSGFELDGVLDVCAPSEALAGRATPPASATWLRCARPHHRCEQSRGWRLEQSSPGGMRWTTPAGRRYTTGR
jgi:hypothetical protein